MTPNNNCSKCGQAVEKFYPDTHICRPCKNKMDRDYRARLKVENRDMLVFDTRLMDDFRCGTFVCY